MPQTTQTYANHVRWHPPFHFFLSPIMTIFLAWSIWRLWKNPDIDHAAMVLLACGFVVAGFLTRVYALKVQDRLIRLEERLRYQRLLPAELAARASELPVRFIVALRFASDEELPDLLRQVIDRKFSKPAEVKKAVKNWRGDDLRV